MSRKIVKKSSDKNTTVEKLALITAVLKLLFEIIDFAKKWF